jgi:hypothetical protein
VLLLQQAVQLLQDRIALDRFLPRQGGGQGALEGAPAPALSQCKKAPPKPRGLRGHEGREGYVPPSPILKPTPMRPASAAVSLSLAQPRRGIEKSRYYGFLSTQQEMASLLNRPPPKP